MSDTCRAVVFHGDGTWALRDDFTVPTPPPGGAVLAVEAVGLCHSDVAQLAGQKHVPGEVCPVVPGHEIVGRVHALADDADLGVEVDDRVAVDIVWFGQPYEGNPFGVRCYGYSFGLDEGAGLWGGYGEYMAVLPGTHLARLTDEVPAAELTLFEPLSNMVAWLGRAQFQAGQTIVIQGPGHMGLTCAAYAKRLGAGQVIVTGTGEDMTRLAVALEVGADHAIDVTADDPVEAVMDLTLHGKIGNIPASEVIVAVDREAPYRIRIRGRAHEVSFYGPNLEIWTEISTVPGSGAFRIRDVLTNNGTYDEEFQIIYHANFGRPLLGKGAKLLAASEKIVPFNANAAKAIAQQALYAAPTKGFTEEVYKIYPKADEDGNTMAVLVNPAGDRGVTVRWPVAQLPYLTQWKNTAAETTGYVTGIEPGTGFPHNRSYERKYGRVPKLGAGQSRTFELDFTILGNAGEVKAAAAAVKELQGDKGPEVQKAPEE